MAVKEVGNVSAEPEIEKLTIRNTTDNQKFLQITSTSSGDGVFTVKDSILHLRSGDTNSFLQVQNQTTGQADGVTQGLTVGVNGNDAYFFNRSGSGSVFIGSSGITAITIDASENATFVANLATNGNATLGDAAADAHIVNGTLRLASEHSSGPSAPADGDGGILYVKDDGKLYFISEDVTETDLTAGGGGGDLTIVATSSATYALSTYNTMVIVDSSSNAVEVDLPTASGNAGKTVDVLAKTGATNEVTVDPNGSETINGSSASYILNQNYTNLTLVSDGTNWVIR